MVILAGKSERFPTRQITGTHGVMDVSGKSVRVRTGEPQVKRTRHENKMRTFSDNDVFSTRSALGNPSPMELSWDTSTAWWQMPERVPTDTQGR